MFTMKSPARLLVTFLAVILAIIAAFIYNNNQTAVVRGKSSAQPLTEEMTKAQELAQNLALSHPQVQRYTVGKRVEVFGIRHILADQYTAAASACATADCRQVEIYNFDDNAAILALVNVETSEVLDVLYQPNIHPGINKRLADRALEIALNAPEVIEALGFQPTQADMVPVDANLKNSICDGNHLCAGPTFELGDRILWAIVDLTEDKLAGIDWTVIEPNKPNSAEFFAGGDCPAPGNVNRDGWTMDYETTGTDSLRVYNITYDGVEVANNIKLVEWHADYGTSGFGDSTGCGGGGGGFPIYPFGETEVLDMVDPVDGVIGFSVNQDFRMSNWGNGCNYRYEQQFEFFNDGRFRVASGAFGKGCGNNALYRPIIRIDIAVDGDAGDSFAYWDGANWITQTTEDYRVPYTEEGHGPHKLTDENHSWRVVDASGSGYYISQDVGQFAPPASPYGNDYPESRSSEPFWYISQHRPSEGDTDLGILGACCNDDHIQGPETFLNNENIANKNIVLWYIPQTDTDITVNDYYCWTVNGDPNAETYPCFVGPMFEPITALSTGFVTNSPVVLGETAVFSNTTAGPAPITYEWTFGDGPTSNSINVNHIYATEGNYTVTLTATNSFATDVSTQIVEVGIPPQAQYTYTGITTTHQIINFTAYTTGTNITAYSWNFGDGEFSNEPHPTHMYAEPGLYNIALVVYSPFGSDRFNGQIEIGETAVASFSHTTPERNKLIQFTNLSTGSQPMNYQWDFGDGDFSADENPTHIYADFGEYEVSLTTTNVYGQHHSATLLLVIEKTYFPIIRTNP